jgi:hypothetical protein
VKLSLCLINVAPRHEDIWRNGGIAPQFLVSALDAGECSAARPCHFTPGERARGTYCVGGLFTYRRIRKSVLFYNGYGLHDGQGFDSR